MNEMTLPSRHRIQSLLPGYLLFMEAPHNIQYLRVSGEESFVSLKPECQSGV